MPIPSLIVRAIAATGAYIKVLARADNKSSSCPPPVCQLGVRSSRDFEAVSPPLAVRPFSPGHDELCDF